MTNIYASKKEFKAREPGQAPMSGGVLAVAIGDALGRLQARLGLPDFKMELVFGLRPFAKIKKGENIPPPAQMRLAGVEDAFMQKAPEDWDRAEQLRKYISEAPSLTELLEQRAKKKAEENEELARGTIEDEILEALGKIIVHHDLASRQIAGLLGISLSSADALKRGTRFPYRAIFRNEKGLARLKKLEGYGLYGAPIEELFKKTGGKGMWKVFAPSYGKKACAEPLSEGEPAPLPSAPTFSGEEELDDDKNDQPPVRAESEDEEERRNPSVFLSFIKEEFPRPPVELPSAAVAELLIEPEDKWKALAEKFPNVWEKSAAEIKASAERLSRKTGVDVARQVVLRESWIACAASFVREMRQAYCSFLGYSPLDKVSRLGEEARGGVELASLDVPLPVYRQAIAEVCAAYRLSTENPQNSQERCARGLIKGYMKITLQAADLK